MQTGKHTHRGEWDVRSNQSSGYKAKNIALQHACHALSFTETLQKFGIYDYNPDYNDGYFKWNIQYSQNRVENRSEHQVNKKTINK